MKMKLTTTKPTFIIINKYFYTNDAAADQSPAGTEHLAHDRLMYT